MSSRTLLVLVCYVVGVLLAGAAALDLIPWAVVAALAAGGVLWRQGLTTRAAALAALAMLGGALNGCHALAAAVAPPFRELGERILAEGAGEIVTVEGRLRGDATPTDYGVALLLDVERVDWRGERFATTGGVRVSVGGTLGFDRMDAWRAGRRVRVPIVLRRPQPYRNPGVPDQGRALALRGIAWLGSAKSGALVEQVGNGTGVSEWAAAARAYTRAAVRTGMAGRDPLHEAIVTAVLVGDRAGIPPDVTDRLQRAGTFHVIAISGGNIAILTALLLGALRLAHVPARARALAAAVGIAAYGMVASGSASVTRATVVALLYLAARGLDLRASGLAVLWSALCALLAWSPLAIVDPGFLLTCGATIGILLSLAPPTRVPEETRGTWPMARHVLTWFGATSRATVAAEIVLLPVAAVVFSRVTIAGLLLNPIAIPLMTIAQVSGLVMVGTAGVAPGVAALAGRAAHAAVEGLLASAGLVDRWTWLSWRMAPPSWLAVVAYYAAWAGWRSSLLEGRRRWSWATLGVALICTWWVTTAPVLLPARSVPHPPGPPRGCTGAAPAASPARPGVLSFVFFDVGQGDSSLVRFPSGEAWLIDTGGLPGATSFDVGARVVAPALWALGVRSLDVLALTHGHPDHAGGAPSLIEDFSVREVWEGVPVPGDPTLAPAESAAAKVGSRWRRQHRGAQLRLGEATVRVLHPPPPDWERRQVRNDDSLVLEVTYLNVRAVFTGDIGRAVEDTLPALLTCDPGERVQLMVLKVPHHGSNGSSGERLLRCLRPSLAVVSVGAGNRFGHPAPAALARYGRLGVPVLRTDQVGAVAVSTDGERVVVSAWDGRGWVERALPPTASRSP